MKTGTLQALPCIEYNVCQDELRKTEDKLQLNEKGLPIGKHSYFVCNFNLQKVRDFIDELQWRLLIRRTAALVSSVAIRLLSACSCYCFRAMGIVCFFFLSSSRWISSHSCETKRELLPDP